MLGVQFVQFGSEGASRDDLVTLRAPPRILVVDDDPGVRSAMSRFLRGRGCSVEVAADGVEGLAQLGRAGFDAIITDIQMPSMDGAEFWLQAIARHPSLSDRFLFCSASPIPAAIPSEHTARFLQKPVAFADLWTALADLLDEAPARPPGDDS
jgi:CheY-like chemotaxis protein